MYVNEILFYILSEWKNLNIFIEKVRERVV